MITTQGRSWTYFIFPLLLTKKVAFSGFFDKCSQINTEPGTEIKGTSSHAQAPPCVHFKIISDCYDQQRWKIHDSAAAGPPFWALFPMFLIHNSAFQAMYSQRD